MHVPGGGRDLGKCTERTREGPASGLLVVNNAFQFRCLYRLSRFGAGFDCMNVHLADFRPIPIQASFVVLCSLGGRIWDSLNVSFNGVMHMRNGSQQLRLELTKRRGNRIE